MAEFQISWRAELEQLLRQVKLLESWMQENGGRSLKGAGTKRSLHELVNELKQKVSEQDETILEL